MADATPLWADTPAELSVATSAALFARSPIVIVASAPHESPDDDPDSAADNADKLADIAENIGAPVLLANTTGDAKADATSEEDAAVAGEIARLGSQWILAADSDAATAAKRLADEASLDVEIVIDSDDLPQVKHPKPIAGLAALIAADAGAVPAARATLAATGAQMYTLKRRDPRADPELISAFAEDKPKKVVAVGAGLGSAERFAARIATAQTGVQLPGGGQVMFPGRTLVALYGYPGSTALGALGQQSLENAIARAKKAAKQYDSLVDGPVVPAFEIIATVATASAGSNGLYSAESSVKKLKPWVEAATDAGLYVVLDLQPGRAKLLDQAKQYQELLKMPGVGLALDPEWKLTPSQRPLQQIGGVDASEVNDVISWLGGFVTEHQLPQKVLVLHQFRLSMLRNESDISMSNDNVAVLIHMDGQGSTGAKEGTWNSVVSAAPKGAVFGWKNFYEKDQPTMNPKETMDRKPVPVMVSYQ